MTIDARNYTDFQSLNRALRESEGDLTVKNCLGERFIGAGEGKRRITLNGVPGNALGCYLNGAHIVVNGNAQDAVGDTMNDGKIVIHGNVGDAVGYAMRGGEILVRGNAGYRAGIHMKAYMDKVPVVVIGNRAGSFLGEYQAGGIIIVLGLDCDDSELIGYFCGTGMHGGKIFLRAKKIERELPPQVNCEKATEEDVKGIRKYIRDYEKTFKRQIPDDGKEFFVLTPNSKNPYKKMYAPN